MLPGYCPPDRRRRQPRRAGRSARGSAALAVALPLLVAAASALPAPVRAGEVSCPWPDHLQLFSQTVNTEETFTGCLSVSAESDFVVGPGGDVTFRAGSLIVLGEGFQVDSSAIFRSEIDPALITGAPVLDPVGDQTVFLGGTLELVLTATDPDDDPLEFGALPLPLPPGAELDSASGAFSFRPDASQLGVLSLTFTVTDGVRSDQETVSITVMDAGGGTALSGTIVDANDTVTPIVGVTVSLLGTGLTTTSDASGSFVLAGLPSGVQVLDLDSSTADPAPDGSSYAGFREALTLIDGVLNEITRPLYLPRLDPDSATTVDPEQTTIVHNPNLNVTLTIVPHSAKNADGSDFVGTMTISEVPQGYEPAELPEALEPGLLITIQPVGIDFEPPAAISFPDVDGMVVGSETNLWSLDPDEGVFVVVGRGVVQADGTIATVSGGIRATDWHGMLPPGLDLSPNEDADPNCLNCCEPCQASAGSAVMLKTGELFEEIEFPSYSSQSRERRLRMRYDSDRAHPSVVVPVDVTVPLIAGVPQVVSYRRSLGGVELGAPVWIDTSGFSETEDETFRIASHLDAAALPTGVYEGVVEITSHYPASSISSTRAGEVMVVNESASPFGAGWSLTQLSRLYPQDTEALLVLGDGRSLEFDNGGDNVAIVQNIGLVEIPVLEGYLEAMGLEPTVFDNEGLEANQLDPFAVVIWNDESFSLQDETTVDLFEQLSGSKPIYLMGDDLAFAAECCLDEPQASVWENLTRLSRTPLNNVGAGTVQITQPLHPVASGPFGTVVSYDYNGDADDTTASGGGVSKLATLDTADVLLAYESGSGARTVVQNTEAFSFVPLASRPVTQTLFQNAVSWLLDSELAQESTYRSPQGDTSTLVRNVDSTYTRTLKDGTVYEYDVQGLQTAVIDRNGNATTYDYDGELLIRITDAVGLETTLDYADGLLSSVTDPAGRTTFFTHDVNRDLREVTFPNGASRSFLYTSRHFLVSQTDERGFETEYEYDAFDRLARTFWPDGSERLVTNLQGAGLVDPASGVGTSGNPAPPVRPEEAVSTLTDGEGRTTTMAGDRFGQATELIDPAGLTTITEYSTDGQALHSERPSGHAFAATYDDAGNLATGTDEILGGTFTFTYEPDFNQFETITDPFDNTTTLLYDGAGNPTTITTPEGRVDTFTYTAEGLLETATDRFDTVTTFTYDAEGRVEQIDAGTGPDQRIVTFTRATDGRVETLTDAEARVTSFTYDAMGWPVTTMLPDTEVVATGWDLGGHLVSVTPPGRPDHEFSYTETGELASYEPPEIGGPVDTTFSYNLAQQLTEVALPDGRSVELAYDAAGRLESREIERGTTTYAYDEETGVLTSIAAPGGQDLAFTYDGDLLTGEAWSGPVAGTVSRTFDAAGRLATESVNGANQVAFAYDDDSLTTQAGAITISRDPQTGFVSTTTLGQVTDTWTYNDFGELIGYEASFGGTPLYSYTLTRDGLGRITAKSETVQGVTTDYDYTYDLRGRLERVDRNAVLAAEYTYDTNGNRLSRNDGITIESGTYDAQDRATSYAGATYSYRQSGELLSRTDLGGTTTYDYDEVGSLLSVTRPDAVLISYDVDGADRRVGKRVNGTPARGFLYRDALEPVAELDGADNLVSRFVYGTRAHVPDYLVRGGATYRILSDRKGSVRLAVDTATGSVAQRLDYDEFGRVGADSNPGFQPFGFAGGLYDPDTGLVRFGARDLDPGPGRWTAKDPIGFMGGETSLYVYPDPINRIDPDGLRPTDADDADRNPGPSGLQIFLSKMVLSGPFKAHFFGKAVIHRFTTGIATGSVAGIATLPAAIVGDRIGTAAAPLFFPATDTAVLTENAFRDLGDLRGPRRDFSRARLRRAGLPVDDPAFSDLYHVPLRLSECSSTLGGTVFR